MRARAMLIEKKRYFITSSVLAKDSEVSINVEHELARNQVTSFTVRRDNDKMFFEFGITNGSHLP